MASEVRSRKNGPNGDADEAKIGRQAVQFLRYCGAWASPRRDWPILRSVSLYPPKVSRNGQWLVVGKAWGEHDKLVAFVRSGDPLTALVAFMAKGAAGQLQWKIDNYVPPDD